MEENLDLRELWEVLWRRKLVIIITTISFSTLGVLYAMSLPNVFRSEIVLAPSQSDYQGGLAGLSSQFGSIASIAGINLGANDGSKVEHAIEFSKSWYFLETLIEKYNLAPDVLAAESWSISTNQLIYNEEMFDPDTGKWIENGSDGKYSSWKAYEALSSMIDVKKDKDNGLIKVSVEHLSPHIAYEWVNLFKKEINLHFQKQDMLEARENIDYLKNKIEETSLSEMQSVFYKMIESQTKTLMLAEVGEQYLLKTVVPAKIAEKKSGPARSIIVILNGLLGFLCSIFYIAIKDVFKL